MLKPPQAYDMNYEIFVWFRCIGIPVLMGCEHIPNKTA